MLTTTLRAAALAIFALAPGARAADMTAIVQDHVIAGYHALAASSRALDAAAQVSCEPSDAGLRAAYGAAFDDWIRVSHLRFGPSETGDRAYALAFWPDTRGKTPKALNALIAGRDPAVDDPGQFAGVSIAARGFYALEFLLYDAGFAEGPAPNYRCALLRAITRDIAATAAAILADWQGGYGDLLIGAGNNDTYRTEKEAVEEMFKALTLGLQITSDGRLGRPMGRVDKPRPRRAEARRSGRSLRHVALGMEATRALALLLAAEDAALAGKLDRRFGRAVQRAGALDDPVFAGVADPMGRFRVEALRQTVEDARQVVLEDLAAALGVAGGFNSLDGD
jgi:predicted lipoprotein